MSSSAVLDLDLRVLAFSLEDGGVKGVGEVNGAGGGVEGELITLGARCILIAASCCADSRSEWQTYIFTYSCITIGYSLGAFVLPGNPARTT
jgi:hypothetical protein